MMLFQYQTLHILAISQRLQFSKKTFVVEGTLRFLTYVVILSSDMYKILNPSIRSVNFTH